MPLLFSIMILSQGPYARVINNLFELIDWSVFVSHLYELPKIDLPVNIEIRQTEWSGRWKFDGSRAMVPSPFDQTRIPSRLIFRKVGPRTS